MGKIKQGILGGFNGTVGTVIGGSWKGIAYMRGKAQSIKNPNTPAQQGHRSKFAMVVAFLQQVKPFIDLGYKGASKMSPYNAAMSHIMKNGINGTAPNFHIDFSRILLAQGSLAPAKEMEIVVDCNQLTVNWTDTSANGEGLATDKAMVLLYNTTKDEAIVNTAAANRSAEAAQVATPSSWAGDHIMLYLAFVAADGSVVSNSINTEFCTESGESLEEVNEEEPENP